MYRRPIKLAESLDRGVLYVLVYGALRAVSKSNPYVMQDRILLAAV